jgi:glycosyltransferase involved in cell wall biosynthesis
MVNFMKRSSSHIVLIPSYNPGGKVVLTVKEALQNWSPVWVVVDGSNDGSKEMLEELARQSEGLRVIVLQQNRGKGAAILEGLRVAGNEGVTHVLTMDSDGQHPANKISEFMALSEKNPQAMILGVPDFGVEAPALRVKGRKISNWWANLETFWEGIGDSLFGFRVYPLQPLKQVMERNRWMRRFDFDPEAAVRLCWAGVKPINLVAPVRYFSKEEGGVSHFQYFRDNKLLTWMHIRLMVEMVLRSPALIFKKLSSQQP